jgi:hypothetical protein
MAWLTGWAEGGVRAEVACSIVVCARRCDGDCAAADRAHHARSSGGHNGTERAPWLEPYGGARRLAHRHVGLNRRATRPLPPPPRSSQRWMVDQRRPHRDAHTETLSALVIWRAEIDDTGGIVARA